MCFPLIISPQAACWTVTCLSYYMQKRIWNVTIRQPFCLMASLIHLQIQYNQTIQSNLALVDQVRAKQRINLRNITLVRCQHPSMRFLWQSQHTAVAQHTRHPSHERTILPIRWIRNRPFETNNRQLTVCLVSRNTGINIPSPRRQSLRVKSF